MWSSDQSCASTSQENMLKEEAKKYMKVKTPITEWINWQSWDRDKMPHPNCEIRFYFFRTKMQWSQNPAAYLVVGNFSWYIYIQKAILRISLIRYLSQHSSDDGYKSFSTQCEIINFEFSTNPEIQSRINPNE